MRACLVLAALAVVARAGFAQWTAVPTGLPGGESVLTVAPVDSLTVWGASSGSTRFVRSTDGGLTWSIGQITGSTDRLIASFSARDSLTAWAALYSPGASVWKTTDGGDSWIRQPSAFPSAAGLPIIIHFFDSATGICVGNPRVSRFEMYRTSTSGAVWLPVGTDSLPAALPGENGTPGEFAARSDTLWFGTTLDRVFRTTDCGATWSAARVGFGEPGEEQVISCAFAPGGFGLAGNGSGIAFTADGGITWAAIGPRPGPSAWSLRHIPETPGSFIVTAFTPGIPGSAITSNGGAAWTSIDAGEYLPSAFATPSAGWCGSAGGGEVYRWTGPPIVSEGGSAIIGGPASFSFRERPVGTISPPELFTLLNSGGDFLTISSIDAPGPDFLIVDPPSMPAVLGPMERVRLQICSSPERTGETHDSLVILSDAPNAPRIRVVLQGAGMRLDRAEPGILYGASDSLFHINPATANATAIARFPSLTTLQCLGVRPSDRTLFGASGGPSGILLYRVSATDATLWPECPVPVSSLRGIAFTADDSLYGISSTGEFFRISLPSGDTIRIGSTPRMFSGLACSPVTGRMLASIRPPLGGRDTIYTIDTHTGIATPLGRTMLGVGTTAIAFGGAGRLYAVTTSGGQNRLYELDTTDAHATLIGVTGARSLNGIAMLGDSGAVAVSDPSGAARPVPVALLPNYPNPFNPSTSIEFAIPGHGRVELQVYDLLGRRVATLADGEYPAGLHRIEWTATGCATGVYLVRLSTGTSVAVRSVLLVR